MRKSDIPGGPNLFGGEARERELGSYIYILNIDIFMFQTLKEYLNIYIFEYIFTYI